MTNKPAASNVKYKAYVYGGYPKHRIIAIEGENIAITTCVALIKNIIIQR